jgi:hypothetical protein
LSTIPGDDALGERTLEHLREEREHVDAETHVGFAAMSK